MSSRGLGESLEIDHAAIVDANGATTHGTARREHTGMLDGTAQDLSTGAGSQTPDYGQVVRLCSPAREDDLARAGPKGGGQLLARLVEGPLSGTRYRVAP